MRKITSILIFLLLAGSLVATASAYTGSGTAEDPYYELYEESDSGSYYSEALSPSVTGTTVGVNYVSFKNVENFRGAYYLEYWNSYNAFTLTYGDNSRSMPVNITDQMGTVTYARGRIGYYKVFNEGGTHTDTVLYLSLTDALDPKSLTGVNTLKLNVSGDLGVSLVGNTGTPYRWFDLATAGDSDDWGFARSSTPTAQIHAYSSPYHQKYYAYFSTDWKSAISAYYDEPETRVDIYKVINGVSYTSQHVICIDDILFDVHSDNYNVTASANFGQAETFIGIKSNLLGSYWHNVTFWAGSGGSSPPSTTPVTLTVKADESGALINGAYAEFTEISSGTSESQTLPFGQGLFEVVGNSGYWVNVTAPGRVWRNATMSFDPDFINSYDVELSLLDYAPENYTYLRFHVYEYGGSWLSGAGVVLNTGEWQSTNTNGYCLFNLSNSQSYTYTVSKTGYTSVTGTITLSDEPYYDEYVRLSIPDSPTPIETTPTGTGGATPTATSDVDLGESARAKAKETLIGGLDAGQGLFYLCILMLMLAVLRRGGK